MFVIGRKCEYLVVEFSETTLTARDSRFYENLTNVNDTYLTTDI